MWIDTFGRWFGSRLGIRLDARTRQTASQLSNVKEPARRSAATSNTRSTNDAARATTLKPPANVVSIANTRYRVAGSKLARRLAPGPRMAAMALRYSSWIGVADCESSRWSSAVPRYTMPRVSEAAACRPGSSEGNAVSSVRAASR